MTMMEAGSDEVHMTNYLKVKKCCSNQENSYIVQKMAYRLVLCKHAMSVASQCL